MRAKLLILFLLFSCTIQAQDFYKPGMCLIKGQVKNYKEPVLNFGITTYLSSASIPVAIDSDGNFSQDYNVTGIPHYILIDKQGVIVNNNAPRAPELNMENGDNDIDALLK